MKDFNSKHLPCHFDKVPRCYVSSKSDRRLEVRTLVWFLGEEDLKEMCLDLWLGLSFQWLL